MFCKVCKDAGKTETEYTSHYVKNKTGKTTCPTLLNQACKYCKEPGHTVKFCKTLKMNEKNKRRDEFFAKKNSECCQATTKKLASSFATAFDSESEDESEDEYPTLETVEFDLNEKVPVATHYVRSYASVLVDDSVAEVENVKIETTPFTIDTSNLKGKFWGKEDSDSDEE
jgi:hypothetical protein